MVRAKGKRLDDLYGLDRPVRLRSCDAPGCEQPGDHRAPRDRTLSSYFFFCLDHVREYNRNWDYFSGMSGGEIESYIRDATTWERPSWPLGQWHMHEQKVRDDIARDFFGEDMATPPPPSLMPKAARDALQELELKPPVDFAAVKIQYRALVKQHHPDANGGSRAAEERFKSINQAFTVLKEFFGEEIVASGA